MPHVASLRIVVLWLNGIMQFDNDNKVLLNRTEQQMCPGTAYINNLIAWFIDLLLKSFTVIME